jgi:hypothetical protein
MLFESVLLLESASKIPTSLPDAVLPVSVLLLAPSAISTPASSTMP